MFRSMADRLVSLRLLNGMRLSRDGAEFYRTYSPCVEGTPTSKMASQCDDCSVRSGGTYTIYLSEPDFDDEETRQTLLNTLDEAYAALPEQAGYFDLPDVRDFVCDKLLIPEAAFDEGVIALLERPKSPVTLGLTYERITSRRKPLVRAGESPDLQSHQESVMPIQLPKKSTTPIGSKYEQLGLRDMPFPSDGFVDPYSTDPRTNGSIYAVSTAQSAITKFESLLIRPDDFPNRVRLAYLWSKGDSQSGRGVGKTALLALLPATHQLRLGANGIQRQVLCRSRVCRVPQPGRPPVHGATRAFRTRRCLQERSARMLRGLRFG